MSLVPDDESGKKNVKKKMNDVTMRMVPTEQALVSLWKQAAQKPNETITYHGLACTIHVNRFDEELKDTTTTATTAIVAESSSKKVGASTTTTTLTMPRGLDSKRQVLEYLQKQCSMDFLRQHGLNSKPDIVLRKANRSSLLKVWNQWRQEMNKSMSQPQPAPSAPHLSLHDATSENTTRHQRKARIAAIYAELLQPPSPLLKTASLSSQPTTDSIEVVAGTLHEDFEELPCYGNEKDSDGSRVNHKDTSCRRRRCRKQLHVCLFLGAVRDMYPMEYEALQGACQSLRIPVVGIRLGTVPEFTSKILSILTFHHAQGRLGTAVLRLAKSNTVDSAKPIAGASHSATISATTPKLSPSCLHVIAMVPLSSDQLSTDLQHRNRSHWSLVRLVVCTLWRSKLASSTSVSAHTNTLTVVFANGVVVTLGETEFVQALAEQHQAAPCEFQILSALSQKVRSITATETVSKKKRALQIIRDVTSSSPLPVTCLLCIEKDGDETTTTTTSSSSASTHRNDSDRLVQNFYGSNASSVTATSRATTTTATATATATPHCHPHHCVVALLTIGTGNATAGEEASERNHKIVQAVIKAASRMGLSVVRHLQLVRHDSSQDWEAATVVALQHFFYQNRMFPPVSLPRVAAEKEEEDDDVLAVNRTSSSSSMKLTKSKKRKHDIK
jgi:hypothetical protein